MKKALIFVLGAIVIYSSVTGCKKSDNNTTTNNDTLSAFAQNLATTCTHTLTFQSDTFAFPTAYTPNGDGINDYYRLAGANHGFTSYQLTVYKINGTKVFQTTNAATGWEGTDTAGARCTDYKYWVRLKFTTSTKTIDTGTFIYLLPTNASPICVKRIAADTANYHFGDQFDPLTGTYSFPTNESFCN